MSNVLEKIFSPNFINLLLKAHFILIFESPYLKRHIVYGIHNMNLVKIFKVESF